MFFFLLFITVVAGAAFRIDTTIQSELSQLCPFSTVCHENSSAPELAGTSCCDNCYCDEGCPKRQDCCEARLNVRRSYGEKEKIACIETNIIQSEQEILTKKSYYMVIGCPEGANPLLINKCLSIRTTTDQPVSSAVTDRIYGNSYCAECNGIFDYSTWLTQMTCSRSIFDDSYSTIFDQIALALDDGQCTVGIKQPDDEKIASHGCSENLISVCNYSGNALPYKARYEQLCRDLYMPYINPETIDVVTYANVYCYLCNQDRLISFSLYQNASCSTVRLLSTPSFSLSVLLGETALAAITRHSNPRPSTPTFGCGNHSIKDQARRCRQTKCPEGQVRSNRKCVKVNIKFVDSYFYAFVKLKPVQPTKELLTSWMNKLDKSQIRLHPLRIAELTVESFSLHYAQKGGSASHFISQVVFTASSFDLHDVLSIFKQSLGQSWQLSLADVNLSCDVSFNKDTVFYQLAGDRVVPLWAHELNKSLEVQDTFYKLRRFHHRHCSGCGVKLTRFFYCEQIVLEEEEVSVISTRLYIKSQERYLHDSEFVIYERGDGTQQVRVCLQDFFQRSFSDRTINNQGFESGYIKRYAIVTMATLSSLLLLVSVVTRLRKPDDFRISDLLVVSISLCVMLLEVLKIWGSFNGSNMGCLVLGVLRHYAWLSLLAWLTLGCWSACKQGATNETLSVKSSIVKCTITFFSSSLFLLVTVVKSLIQSQYTEIGYGWPFCFVDSNTMLIATFVSPVTLVTVANLAMCVVAHRRQRGDNDDDALKELFHLLARFCGLSVLLSFVCVAEYLSQALEMDMLRYVSPFLGSTIGFVTFVMFTCNKTTFTFYFIRHSVSSD